jgi:cytochrome c-type biogenesis protein CcmH
MVLGAAGILAVLAIAVLFFRPSDRPIAASGTAATAQSGDPSATKLDDVDTMISRLEARLQKNPADGEGFRMLGWSFQNTGKPAEAVLAYANAAKLLPKRADVHAGYGEALAAVAGDRVTPEAKSHFDEALRLDAKEPRARFFASLYKAQNGNERAALDEWIALSNSAAPDQPWQADVHQRVEKLAAKLGVDVSSRLKPLSAVQTPISNSAGGPNAAQVAAASALPAAQQQSMIDGMVNGLATKLQANPNDVDGWLKLIRSRVVLKDNARAKDDLAMARKAFGTQPSKLNQINALARELGL